MIAILAGIVPVMLGLAAIPLVSSLGKKSPKTR
jgi:hypothetical protein